MLNDDPKSVAPALGGTAEPFAGGKEPRQSAEPLDAYGPEMALAPRLDLVEAASLASHDPPPRSWLVEELIPERTVTLMNGDGGTGKSLLALQLAVATANSGYWAGQEVKPGSCLYVSAEDDIDELHRRLADIGAAVQTEIADMGQLTILPLAGEDALLAAPAGILKPTPLSCRSKPMCASTVPH